MTLRIGSLFSGAGGLDRAVEEVFGGQVVWQSEIDKAASKVLAHRFPDVPNLGDITQIDWSNWKPMLEVDVLCGGFPCTDVSAAGKRAGMHGTRSGLWSHMSEAIDVLRPQYVIIENVRGLLNANANRPMESDTDDLGNGSDRPVLRAIGAVLGDLADIGGYEARWFTLAASAVGAPHRRERVFIVAADTSRERRAGSVESRQDVVGNGSQSAHVGSYGGVAVSGNAVALLPTPTTQDGANNGGPSQFQRNTLPLNAEVTLLPTPNAPDGSGGGQHPDKREGHSRQLIDFVLALGEESNAAPEGRPGEELRDMRDTAGTQTVRQRSAGRSQRVPEEGALLTVMREHPEADPSGQPPLAGAADQTEGSLRGLRHNEEAAHPSQGSESGEQRSVEPGGAVQQLPQEAALAGGPRSDRHPDTGSRWGRYEAAIRRWENVLGRPAPDPTEPNKNGNPRLAAEFSSWLMGWPAGWVTDPDIGISRNDQLRIVGNGVCTQQAIAALRYLLGVTTDTHTHTHTHRERADVNALLPTPRASDPSNATSHSSPGFRPQLGEVVRTLGANKNAVAE